MLPKELQVYNHIETLPEEVRDCRKACYFQLTPTPTDQLNMAGEVGCWEDTFLSDTVSCVDRDVCWYFVLCVLSRPCSPTFPLLSRQIHRDRTARLL